MTNVIDLPIHLGTTELVCLIMCLPINDWYVIMDQPEYLVSVLFTVLLYTGWPKKNIWHIYNNYM